MYRLYSRQESKRFEAYRLAGVGMMVGTMPNGDERVTISVPGAEKRRAIGAEAVRIALTELRGEVIGLRDPEDTDWPSSSHTASSGARSVMGAWCHYNAALRAVLALIDNRLEETQKP